MGLAFSVIAVEHNIYAPELGDCGMLGVPSLQLNRQPYTLNTEYSHLQYSFGWFYEAFSALRTRTHELEQFHLFLRTYPHDRLLLYSDHDAFSDPIFNTYNPDDAEPFQPPQDPTNYLKADYVVEDPETQERMCTEHWDWFLPFEPFSLTPDIWTILDQRLLSLSSSELNDHIYRTSPIHNPNYDLGALIAFLQNHRNKPLRVSLNVHPDE